MGEAATSLMDYWSRNEHLRSQTITALPNLEAGMEEMLNHRSETLGMAGSDHG